MAEAEDVANVRRAGKAGPQFWAASMTYLERKYPEKWGKRADESAGPKVVVQIGCKDSDVAIQVINVNGCSNETALPVPGESGVHMQPAYADTSNP